MRSREGASRHVTSHVEFSAAHSDHNDKTVFGKGNDDDDDGDGARQGQHRSSSSSIIKMGSGLGGAGGGEEEEEDEGEWATITPVNGRCLQMREGESSSLGIRVPEMVK